MIYSVVSVSSKTSVVEINYTTDNNHSSTTATKSYNNNNNFNINGNNINNHKSSSSSSCTMKNKKMMTSSRDYYHIYNKNLLRYHLQWRPIRAIIEQYYNRNDLIISENEPERVVFSEDIQMFLYKLKKKETNHHDNNTNCRRFNCNLCYHYNEIDRIINQRLVIRILESLGLNLHYSQYSHNQSQRLCSFYTNSSDDINNSIDQELLNIIMNTATSNNSIYRNDDDDDNDDHRRNSNNSSNSLHQILLTRSNDMICLLSQKLLYNSMMSIKCKIDSELDFIIYLLYDIILCDMNSNNNVGSSCSNIGKGSGIDDDNGSNDDMKCLSNDFIIELRCLLIYLLTVKYKLDIHVLNTSSSSSSSYINNNDYNNNYNIVHDNMMIIEMTKRLQLRCRQLIEQTIPKRMETSNIKSSSSNSSDSGNTNNANNEHAKISSIGNLYVWCSYIEVEITLGNFDDAMKVLTKLLINLIIYN